MQKFEYISTLGVAGKLPGYIPEEELPEREFHNHYERTKSRSESEVLAAYKENGLPVTIHRPSMIIGHSQTGKNIRFQGFYFLSKLFTGRQTFGCLPSLPDLTFDLIPSDYIAQIISCSLNTPAETIGRIFHLCSGADYAISCTDLIKYLRHYHKTRSQNLPKTIFISPTLFLLGMKIMASLSFNPKLKKSVKGIANYFRHIKTIQTFENTQTRAFFEQHGIMLEYPENYLGRVLDYYGVNKRNIK